MSKESDQAPQRGDSWACACGTYAPSPKLPASEAVGAATDADVEHLVVFAHGLTNKVTKSNLAHGRAILRAYEVKALEITV